MVFSFSLVSLPLFRCLHAALPTHSDCFNKTSEKFPLRLRRKHFLSSIYCMATRLYLSLLLNGEQTSGGLNSGSAFTWSTWIYS